MADSSPLDINAETVTKPSYNTNMLLLDEVVERILASASLKDMYRYQRVCKRWRSLVSSVSLQEIDLLPFEGQLGETGSNLEFILNRKATHRVVSLKLPLDSELVISQISYLKDNLTQLTLKWVRLVDLMEFRNLKRLKAETISELYVVSTVTELSYQFLCNLKSLDAGKVSVECLEYVWKTFGPITCLHALSLHGNKKKASRPFFSSCPNAVSLSCRNMDLDTLLVDDASRDWFKSLKRLTIDSCGGDVNRIIMCCPSLESLTAEDPFCDGDFDCGFLGTKNALKYLRIKFTDDLIVEAMQYLPLETKIARLDVSHTPLANDVSFINFIVDRGYDLRYLGIGRSGMCRPVTSIMFRTMGMTKFETLLCTFSHLEGLNICGHTDIDDSIFQVISRSAKYLRFLNVSGTSCTPRGLEAFLWDRIERIQLGNYHLPLLHVVVSSFVKPDIFGLLRKARINVRKPGSRCFNDLFSYWPIDIVEM